MPALVLPHRFVSSAGAGLDVSGTGTGTGMEPGTGSLEATAKVTGPAVKSVPNATQKQQQQQSHQQYSQHQYLSMLPSPSLSSLSLSLKTTSPPASSSTTTTAITAAASSDSTTGNAGAIDAAAAASTTSSSSRINLSNLPTELILQIFSHLPPRPADAFALSKTNRRLRAVFTAHTDRIFLQFAHRCLPCYPEALALAELQLRLSADRKTGRSRSTAEAPVDASESGGAGSEAVGCSSLGAVLRRNHRLVFRAARHSMARENVSSKFRLAIDWPEPKGAAFALDDHSLVDQLDEQCKLAISTEYSINRLLLAPLRECSAILDEIVTRPEQPGVIPITLRMLRLSVLLRAKSYSETELDLYFVSKRADWDQLLAEISAHMRRVREATAVRAVN